MTFIAAVRAADFVCGIHRNRCPSSIASFVTSRSTPAPTNSSTTVPSTPGQLVLMRILVEELRALGLDDVDLDEHGYLMATVPATA